MTAEDYLRAVGFDLRDLPWKMRRDLISELRDHLAELPPGTDLTAELGSPQEYAADLRDAAGLERRSGAIAFLRARRPRNVILVVVALTLIGLAIGAVEWVNAYQPLVAAGTMEFPAGAKQDNAGGIESVVFHQGKPFRFAMDITNAGSHTVRVLGVPFGPGERPFAARLVVSGPSLGGTVMPLSRFHPFDLPPGQIRLFVLNGVYRYRCPTGMRGTILSLDDLPVRFKFLWRTATTDVPLPEPLRIVFRKGSCATR